MLSFWTDAGCPTKFGSGAGVLAVGRASFLLHLHLKDGVSVHLHEFRRALNREMHTVSCFHILYESCPISHVTPLLADEVRDLAHEPWIKPRTQVGVEVCIMYEDFVRLGALILRGDQEAFDVLSNLLSNAPGIEPGRVVEVVARQPQSAAGGSVP